MDGNHLDEKETVEHLAVQPTKVAIAAEDFVVDNSDYHSRLNELGFWQTVKLFKVATFCCFIGSFGALSDNYQLSIPGNVLALPGFVQTMGTPDPTAEYGYTIPTAHVSAWSGKCIQTIVCFSLIVAGIQTAAQMVVLIVCAWYPPHDRFGRKPVLFSVQVFMSIACLIEMFAKSWGVWAVAKVFNVRPMT